MSRRFLSLMAFGMTALILASVVSATAASNTVPKTAVGDSSRTTTVDARKPDECSTITLTVVSVNAGNFNGTAANELLLGRTAAQTIDGAGGNDCILGGDGNDTLKGSAGNDVILGGPGNDSLSGGPGTDICYGGDGTDTFNADCETRIQ